MKQQKIKDCNNISKIIVRGQLIFVLSKDVFVLNPQLETVYLFLMQADPVDLWFPPTNPTIFYAFCEDNLRIVRFDQADPLDYYDQISKNGRSITQQDMKLILK